MLLLGIGPPGNLAEFLRRRPDLAPRVDAVVMLGAVERGYGGKPQSERPTPEYNCACDVAAARVVLAAPWRSLLLCPLDVAEGCFARGAPYARVLAARDAGDALVAEVLSAFEWWLERMTPRKLIAKWASTRRPAAWPPTRARSGTRSRSRSRGGSRAGPPRPRRCASSARASR